VKPKIGSQRRSRVKRPRKLRVTPVESVPGARLVSKLLTDIEVCQVEQKLASGLGHPRSKVVTDEMAAKLESRMTLSSIVRAVNDDTEYHLKSRLYRY